MSDKERSDYINVAGTHPLLIALWRAAWEWQNALPLPPTQRNNQRQMEAHSNLCNAVAALGEPPA